VDYICDPAIIRADETIALLPSLMKKEWERAWDILAATSGSNERSFDVLFARAADRVRRVRWRLS
jgi:hypothetical protein